MSERRLAVLLHHLLPCDTVSAAPAASAPAASSLDLPRKKGSAKTVTLGDWQGMVGTEVGVSDWLHLTQDRVDAFSQVTGDPQWIHQRDAKEKGSPFGGPIAHGFLVVALASYLAEGTTPGLQGTKMGVNYGLDSLRFVSPVPVGKRIRMRMTLGEVKVLDKPAGVQNTMKCSIEVEGAKKPSVVFNWLTRAYL